MQFIGETEQLQRVSLMVLEALHVDELFIHRQCGAGRNNKHNNDLSPAVFEVINVVCCTRNSTIHKARSNVLSEEPLLEMLDLAFQISTINQPFISR